MFEDQIKEFYNKIAENEESYREKKSRIYHDNIAKNIKFIVPEKSSILELGCAYGSLLNQLKPSYGVGVDFSEKMIEKGRALFPNLKFICTDIQKMNIEEQFDYIIIVDTLCYHRDIAQVFEKIRRNCTHDTRLIIVNYNFLWEPILKLAMFLGFKRKRPFTNWISLHDIRNFLYLGDFDVIKSDYFFLFPQYIPVISSFFNRYIAHLPLIRRFCMMQMVVARKVEPNEDLQEYSVSVIIPTRNEKGNIENAIRRMPIFGKSIEIIFVDGNSTDGTQEEIHRVMRSYPEKNIRFLSQGDGVGKGDAVRKGFADARGQVLMILDADLTVAPEDLPKFYYALATGKGEFINGCRMVYTMEDEAMRMLNVFGNKFFSYVFTYLLVQPFKDTLCGTKVLLKRHYEKIAKNRSYFGDFDPFGDFDLIFGASKLCLKIVEMPVLYRKRGYGKTSIKRFSHGWLLLRMCLFAMRKIRFT